MSDRSNKNSAVSPVIGTILLVAITVVLIAIIAAVIMGLADAEDGKKVGMNAQPDNINTSKAKLILYGGESLSELVKLEMIDHDSPNGEYVILWEGPAGTVNVGIPYTTLEDVAKPLKDMAVYDTRINVKGTFTDGREVVLLVQPMTFYDVKGPKIPSKVAEYINKVFFNGIDITDNHNKTTGGFVATTDQYFDNDDYGASIAGSTFAVQLVDPLPNAVGKIKIRRIAVTKGVTKAWNWDYNFVSDDGGKTFSLFKFDSKYGGVEGNVLTTIPRGSQHAGLKSSPTALWKWSVQIYDEAGSKIIAEDVWYTESSIP